MCNNLLRLFGDGIFFTLMPFSFLLSLCFDDGSVKQTFLIEHSMQCFINKCILLVYSLISVNV